MAIIVLQHTPTEDTGRLGATLRDHGKRLDVRRLDLPIGGPLKNRHIPTDFDDVEGIISLGGAMNVDDHLPWIKPEMEFLREAHKRNLPVVGICLGAQLIAEALGGSVGKMTPGQGSERGGEWGMMPVQQYPVANTETILTGVPWTSTQFLAHGYEVKTVPPGATALQFTPGCKVQSFKVGMRTCGFQYHFECDMPAIEGFFSCDDPLVACCGKAPTEGLADAKRQYAAYARVSERLCMNLATYVFNVSRRVAV